MTTPHSRSRPWRSLLGLLCAVAVVALAGCDSEPKTTTQDDCDSYVNAEKWDKAITECSAIDTDDGHRKTAQAYMGRAGITILDLIDGLADTTLDGLALIMSVFTVATTSFADVDSAIAEFYQITTLTEEDYFLMLIASDVILASILKSSMGATVDTATGDITIPGITDTDLATLSDTSTASEIQTAMDGIYSGTYYQTTFPDWEDTAADFDLSRVSTYVAANNLAQANYTLDALTTLDFAGDLDNGDCALDSTQTASNVDNTTDGPLVAAAFPRRLNTSHTSGDYLTEEMTYVLFDNTGTIDATKEWAGNYLLPSALLNPDHYKVECDGDTTAALDEFSTCMSTSQTGIGGAPASEVLDVDATKTTLADGTGTICDGSNCSFWPLLQIDDNLTNDDAATATNGADAMTELAAILHSVAPIDNSVTAPTGSRPDYACEAGDDIVHYREFDSFLRNFGQ